MARRPSKGVRRSHLAGLVVVSRVAGHCGGLAAPGTPPASTLSLRNFGIVCLLCSARLGANAADGLLRVAPPPRVATPPPQRRPRSFLAQSLDLTNPLKWGELEQVSHQGRFVLRGRPMTAGRALDAGRCPFASQARLDQTRDRCSEVASARLESGLDQRKVNPRQFRSLLT